MLGWISNQDDTMSYIKHDFEFEFFLFFLKKGAISKTRHWNHGIGIGIGTDTTKAIISSSIRPMDTKPSRVVI